MQSLNINRKTTDSFYRYKMPKLIAKIEGRGNGIKTVISNLVEIAKSLNRPPLYPLKFIGCELGTQTATDAKNDRYIINGAHDSEKLQSILFMFIEKFVLCQKCHNPETTLTVLTKKEKILIKCAACGHQSSLTNSTRVTSYILKNPPKATADSYSKSSKTGQIDQELKNAKKTAGNASGNSAATLGSSTEALGSAREAANASAKEDIPDLSIQAIEDDRSKSGVADMTSQAKMTPMMTLDSVDLAETEQLTERLKVLCHESDSAKPFKERIALFENFLMERYSKDSNMMLYIHEVLGEIKRLDITSKAIIAVCECIFNDNNFIQVLKLNCIPLAMITFENNKSQSYMLECVEKIISEKQETLLNQSSLIFKILYDMNIVSEEVFLKWETKKTFRWIDSAMHEKLLAAATQFFDWLKTEEESDEEDSDEDDSEDDDQSTTAANTSVNKSPEYGLNDSNASQETGTADDNSRNRSYDWNPTRGDNAVAQSVSDEDSDINIDDI